MAGGGYVRLYRRLLGHPAFRDWSEIGMFVGMIAMAQWKDGRVRYRDREIELKRGQLAISIRDLAAKCGVDKSKISRVLQRFVTRDMIETATETGVNVITICNYEKYQSLDDDAETVTERIPIQKRDRSETQNNKEKKGKKDNTPSIISPAIVPELAAWAVENMGWSRSQAANEADRFHDWATATGRKYIDWMAAWRNWCRSPYQKTQSPVQQPLTL